MAYYRLKIKACALSFALSVAAIGTLSAYKIKGGVIGVCLVALIAQFSYNVVNELLLQWSPKKSLTDTHKIE